MSDLIQRQDAIDAALTFLVEYCGAAFDEDMQKMLCERLDALPSAESERKWIPVTESLPEDGERVLITHKGGVSFGWYNGSYWERGAPTNHRPLQTVIAWMPLPEPAKR